MGETPPDPPPRHVHSAAALRADLRSAGIGFGAGILNGLLGVGGGIILVPGLIFLRGLTVRQAVSTSLGVVLCLSSVALAVHLTLSGLYFSPLGSVLLLAAGAAGSQVGSWLLNRISQRWILYIFAAFTFISSVQLILQGLGITGQGAPPVLGPPLWSYAPIGAVAGLFSGMLGVGGGGIVVLGFSALFQTPILGGLPLALAINLANATSGLLAQRKTGQTHWREVVRLVPAALLGIALGVALAVVMPANLLRILFAAFFIYMGTRLALRGRKS